MGRNIGGVLEAGGRDRDADGGVARVQRAAHRGLGRGALDLKFVPGPGGKAERHAGGGVDVCGCWGGRVRDVRIGQRYLRDLSGPSWGSRGGAGGCDLPGADYTEKDATTSYRGTGAARATPVYPPGEAREIGRSSRVLRVIGKTLPMTRWPRLRARLEQVNPVFARLDFCALRMQRTADRPAPARGGAAFMPYVRIII